MVCVMGARVDMVDEYGLGPLFYFSPNILSNAYWNWMEGPEDEDILTEPGKSMARQRAMSALAFEIDTSLKLLSEMCRQGADVNQFGVFPKTQAQSYSTRKIWKVGDRVLPWSRRCLPSLRISTMCMDQTTTAGAFETNQSCKPNAGRLSEIGW